MITKRAITPLNILIKETLIKCKHKRFSLYKNDIGHFKLTFREQMLKDLILLKYYLVTLRKERIYTRALHEKFKADRIAYQIKYPKYCNCSIEVLWELELKTRKRKGVKNG